jgi:hypothetical protein
MNISSIDKSIEFYNINLINHFKKKFSKTHNHFLRNSLIKEFIISLDK